MNCQTCKPVIALAFAIAGGMGAFGEDAKAADGDLPPGTLLGTKTVELVIHPGNPSGRGGYKTPWDSWMPGDPVPICETGHLVVNADRFPKEAFGDDMNFYRPVAYPILFPHEPCAPTSSSPIWARRFLLFGFNHLHVNANNFVLADKATGKMLSDEDLIAIVEVEFGTSGVRDGDPAAADEKDRPNRLALRTQNFTGNGHNSQSVETPQNSAITADNFTVNLVTGNVYDTATKKVYGNIGAHGNITPNAVRTVGNFMAFEIRRDDHDALASSKDKRTDGFALRNPIYMESIKAHLEYRVPFPEEEIVEEPGIPLPPGKFPWGYKTKEHIPAGFSIPNPGGGAPFRSIAGAEGSQFGITQADVDAGLMKDLKAIYFEVKNANTANPYSIRMHNFEKPGSDHNDWTVDIKQEKFFMDLGRVDLKNPARTADLRVSEARNTAGFFAPGGQLNFRFLRMGNDGKGRELILERVVLLFEDPDFKEWVYVQAGDGIELIAYNGKDADVAIPEEIDGHKVVSLADELFMGYDNIKSVAIPQSVNNIGYMVFSGCASLGSFSVDPNNETFCTEDGILFEKNRTGMLRYPPAKEGASYTVPDRITSCWSGTFQDCVNLTRIELPEGLEAVGYSVFIRSAKLSEVHFLGSKPAVFDPHGFIGTAPDFKITHPAKYADSWEKEGTIVAPK